MMKLSTTGLDLIKSYEGYRAKPYNDGGGVMTIGYGHVIHPNDVFDEVSETEALALLRFDLERYEKTVNTYVSVPLTQSQYDSLVSLCFNIGRRAFERSTLLRLLNEGDYEGAAKQFHVWRKDNGKVVRGLVKRRAREAKYFETGEDA